MFAGILGAAVEGQLNPPDDHSGDGARQRVGGHRGGHVQLRRVLVIITEMATMMLSKETLWASPCQWPRSRGEQHKGTRHNRQRWFSQSKRWSLLVVLKRFYRIIMKISGWRENSPQSWIGMSPAYVTEIKERAARKQSIFWKSQCITTRTDSKCSA